MQLTIQVRNIDQFIALRQKAIDELRRGGWSGAAYQLENALTLHEAALKVASVYFLEQGEYPENAKLAIDVLTREIPLPDDMLCRELVKAAIDERDFTGVKSITVEVDEWQFVTGKKLADGRLMTGLSPEGSK